MERTSVFVRACMCVRARACVHVDVQKIKEISTFACACVPKHTPVHTDAPRHFSFVFASREARLPMKI
jgi:hypothetical protein